MSEHYYIGGQSAEYMLSREYQLYDYCGSDSLSEEGLREIIERYGFTPKSHPCPMRDNDFFLEACGNERVTEEIIQCLLEYFPDAAGATDGDNWSSLHYAFYNNKNMTLNIVQRLIDASPDSVREAHRDGDMPIHHLCGHANCIDETVAVEILTFLLKKCPEAARHGAERGRLPLFFACLKKSPEFCRVLIEAYPGSERVADSIGIMPLHLACAHNAVTTVEYLYKLYPDAINHASIDGYYPIHFAIDSITERDDPERAIEIVKFLLDCNPHVKVQKCVMRSPLRLACDREYNDSNIETGIQIIKIIYDAQPEAIENEFDIFCMRFFHQQVQSFMIGELVYARQAKHHRMMTTPDDNGRLPLHRALVANNVTLGSIKLLVKGNPSAIRTFDNSGIIPLHVACHHQVSACVVQYLLDLDMRTLRTVDYGNNSALHYACWGAKYETIALLLEKYAVLVSKPNAQKKLPIDLLWESHAVDRDSIEYTGSVFRLLKAYPEMIMNCNVNTKQQTKAGECPSQNGKKRKYDNT